MSSQQVQILVEGGVSGTGYFISTRYQLFTALELQDVHRFTLVAGDEDLGRFQINPAALTIRTPGVNQSYLIAPDPIETDD